MGTKPIAFFMSITFLNTCTDNSLYRNYYIYIKLDQL